MQTFIFGHRNPDTDSVCASIALSYLLNETGKNTVPKVLGHLNNESKFVLNYFKVKEPDYLNDTKVRIKDIKYNKKAIAHEDDSIYDTFLYMQKEGVTAIPLVDHAKKLTGFVSLKEIAKFLISGDKESVDTSYDNIVSSLDGIALLQFDQNIKGNVMVASFQSKTFHEEVMLTNDDVLIVGDRYKILDYAIEARVKLIVLTGNHVLPSKLLKKAEKNKINVILSKYNSLETANKVLLSNRIHSINMNAKPITINSKAYRTDFLDLASKVGHTNYPVVNYKNECLGHLSESEEKEYIDFINQKQYEQCCNQVYASKQATLRKI